MALACGLLGLAVVNGCGYTTTTTQSARLKLKATRTLASQKPVKPGPADGAIEVLSASLVEGDSRSAIAVRLRNNGDAVTNDVQIAAGVEQDGKPNFVNLEKNTPYFQSHVGGIAPSEELTWVYVSKKKIPEGTPVVEPGAREDKIEASGAALPELELGAVTTSEKGGDATAEIEVTNASEVPQLELEVYAWAEDGGRVRAAGSGSIEELAPGATETVDVPLLGEPGDSEIQASAPPTIFE